MAKEDGGPWVALRRAYAPAPRPEVTASPVCTLSDLDFATPRDLAEERAAIMEYSGGLPRADAEALAYKAHGLPLPKLKKVRSFPRPDDGGR